MRTLPELAEAAKLVDVLEVTPEEKDLLDWFVRGLPGYGEHGECHQLHGALILVVVDNGSKV